MEYVFCHQELFEEGKNSTVQTLPLTVRLYYMNIFGVVSLQSPFRQFSLITFTCGLLILFSPFVFGGFSFLVYNSISISIMTTRSRIRSISTLMKVILIVFYEYKYIDKRSCTTKTIKKKWQHQQRRILCIQLRSIERWECFRETNLL